MKIQQETTWGNLSTCFYMKYINVANFESFTEPSGVRAPKGSVVNFTACQHFIELI